MEIRFTRARGDNDWIRAERPDGQVVSWPSRRRGQQVPHDLVHLVVENALGMTDGFWGLVADGVDFGFLIGEADRIARGGTADRLQGRDPGGLVFAETVVGAVVVAEITGVDDDACLAALRADRRATRGPRAAALTVPRVAAARRGLAEARAGWDALAEGGSLTLAFAPSPSGYGGGRTGPATSERT